MDNLINFKSVFPILIQLYRYTPYAWVFLYDLIISRWMLSQLGLEKKL
jgi:hypothetical protein